MKQGNRARRSRADAGRQDSADPLQRSRLAAEAQELVAIYRGLAGLMPTPWELPGAAFAIGRALGNLDEPQGSRQSVDRAAKELASARATLTRIRSSVSR